MGKQYSPEEDRVLRDWDTAPRDERCSIPALARQIGRPPSSVISRLGHQRRLIANGVDPNGPFSQKRGARNLYHVAGLHEEPDPEAVRKRDELERSLLTAHLTFGQQFFGDPLPTRSALEQRGQEMRT